MIGGAGVRGSKAADYPRKTSTCEGQELGRGVLKPLTLLSTASVTMIHKLPLHKINFFTLHI